MSAVAIRVENLSKRYRLGTGTEQYDTLRDTIAAAAKAPFRRFMRLSGSRGSDKETLWALNDVSFEVQEGEVLGIIGRNGAGKSTLLKILSRITRPTSGRAEIFGRVGSLLEVGTGFHPELTGRENIYLNGAVLGMRKTEIDRQFDSIIDFAGIEQFLDTPVKRYSSGMFVRLAFAVAAHLDTEILLVDEVLAVGDMGFQKKCLGKMSEVTQQGRTVLFVSHNMGAIRKLCRTVLFIDSGTVAYKGDTEKGVEGYIGTFSGQVSGQALVVVNRSMFSSSKGDRITGFEIVGINSQPLEYIRTGDPVVFRIHYEIDHMLRNPNIRLQILSENRIELLRLSTAVISGIHVPAVMGKARAELTLQRFPFTAGNYLLDLALTAVGQGVLDHLEQVAVIKVQGGDPYGTGVQLTTRHGFFTCDHKWRVETTDNTYEITHVKNAITAHRKADLL